MVEIYALRNHKLREVLWQFDLSHRPSLIPVADAVHVWQFVEQKEAGAVVGGQALYK